MEVANENKRTDRIREFSEGDPNIFDTEEEAMEAIKKTKRKKNSVIGVHFGVNVNKN